MSAENVPFVVNRLTLDDMAFALGKASGAVTDAGYRQLILFCRALLMDSERLAGDAFDWPSPTDLQALPEVGMSELVTLALQGCG